jgi:hypothetical protein
MSKALMRETREGQGGFIREIHLMHFRFCHIPSLYHAQRKHKVHTYFARVLQAFRVLAGQTPSHSATEGVLAVRANDLSLDS